MAVQNVEWRGHSNARAEKQEEQQQLQAIHGLGRDLQSLRTFGFAAVLLATAGPSADTKLGPAPAGSALSYQQANLPAGFTMWMSPSISEGAATVTSVPAPTLHGRNLADYCAQQAHG